MAVPVMQSTSANCNSCMYHAVSGRNVAINVV